MNEPVFVISGEERRKVKKERNLFKSFVKNFWHNHQTDKDMYTAYGCEHQMMKDETAELMYNDAKQKVTELEKKLAEKLC